MIKSLLLVLVLTLGFLGSESARAEGFYVGPLAGYSFTSSSSAFAYGGQIGVHMAGYDLGLGAIGNSFGASTTNWQVGAVGKSWFTGAPLYLGLNAGLNFASAPLASASSFFAGPEVGLSLPLGGGISLDPALNCNIQFPSGQSVYGLFNLFALLKFAI